MSTVGLWMGIMERLKGAGHWVLCALAEGEAHGYLIALRIRDLADGEIGVGTGTLYAAIERLAGENLIELSKEEVVDGRNRRAYRITGSGLRAVGDETERRFRAVIRVQRRLGLGLA